MTLQEFLATASPDHNEALRQWQEYKPLPYLWRIEGAVRKTQVETALIINDTETRLNNLIADPSTPEPIRALAKKVLRSLMKLYEVEFYINLADPEVAAMFSAAQSFGVLNMDEVTRVTAAALYEPVNPQPNATLHDVLVIREACPVKPVSVVNGWVTITTAADTPLHNPRLLAFNPRTEQWQRVNSFYGVSAAGSYDAQLPREWLGAELAVDDAYGVI